MSLNSEWMEVSQSVDFPSQVSKLDRIAIRKAIIDQESLPDDWDDCGVIILGEQQQAVTAVLPKRVATAFKTVLGDICGHPEAGFLESFYAWKQEREDYMAEHPEEFEDDEEYNDDDEDEDDYEEYRIIDE